jgi:hypothetical protein
MLIHKIGDLRSLFEGDLRLLEQFKGSAKWLSHEIG